MDQYKKYAPQLRLPEVGEWGQQKLSESAVLIVGCGALGSPLAMYLAGAGVGRIVLADFDTIDTSNLHRQIFYTEDEIGMYKAECLQKRIASLNSDIKVTVVKKFVTGKFFKDTELQFDVLADAADNPDTTYLLDKYSQENNIPFSTAGISGWSAQIFTYIPGSFAYSDIFARPDEAAGVLPCSVTGVMGPVAGVAASIQAAEILKMILGLQGDKSKLIYADLLRGSFSLSIGSS